MTTEITSAVHLDIEIGDNNICADIGTIIVPVQDGTVDEGKLHKILGGLLKDAGEYLLSTGMMPYLEAAPLASTPPPAAPSTLLPPQG